MMVPIVGEAVSTGEKATGMQGLNQTASTLPHHKQSKRSAVELWRRQGGNAGL